MGSFTDDLYFFLQIFVMWQKEFRNNRRQPWGVAEILGGLETIRR